MSDAKIDKLKQIINDLLYTLCVTGFRPTDDKINSADKLKKIIRNRVLKKRRQGR